MRQVLAWAWLGAAVLACSPAPLVPRVVPSSWNPHVAVRVVPAFRAAVLPVTGAGSQWGWALWKLDMEARRTGLTPTGPVFVRWLTDAAHVPEEQMRWEVGVPIQPSDQVRPPLELREFREQLVAFTRTRAPVDEAHHQWRGMVEWVLGNGYQPSGAWTMVLNHIGSVDEIELRIPVFEVSPLLQVLRALVCVTGLAISALFLFSWLRRRPAGARPRGGVLWVLVGAACVVMYVKPLADDLLYLYGDFLPERLGAWVPVFGGLEYLAIALVAPLLAHLFFRLMAPRLSLRWAFRGALGALYALTLLTSVPFAMGVAPAWLVHAEVSGLAGARVVAAVLLLAAMLAAPRAGRSGPDGAVAADGGRGERPVYLALAALALALEAASFVVRDPWTAGVIELSIWALPAPVLVALTWFRERVAMLDVLAKRGVFVLAALLALATYFAVVPGLLWRPGIGWKGGWVFPVSALPFVILAPWLSSWLSARLDRSWLGRAFSPAQAQRFFLAGVGSATSERELLRNAEDRVATIFPPLRGPGARRRVEISLEDGPPSGAPPGDAFQAPVLSHGQRVGTMRIETPPDARPFLSEDQALFASLGEALGLALEALRLRERKLAQERAEQELRVLTSRAELRALRAQINPHFVFNALNAIAELIATDPVKAERTVERLAEVLRHTLHRPDAEWVRVEEELAMARAYLEVERIRFGTRLELLVEVGEGAAALLLPTLMVQTLVENAVKHGIAPHPGPGRVEVRARRDGATLRVEVRDTGPGFAMGRPPAPGAGLGLRNVQARLAGYFGEEGSLGVERDEEAAMTVVSLSMPAVLEPVRAIP